MASEAALRSAMRAAEVGTWRIDLEAETIACDAVCLAMLGLTGEDTEIPLADLVGYIAEEHRGEFFARLQAAALTGSYEFEHRMVRQDGASCWTRAIGSRPRDGTTGCLMGIALDVTATHEAEAAVARREETLRLLEQATNIGLYETDGSLRTTGSANFYRQLGLPEGTPFDFLAMLELVHPEDRESLRLHVEAALSDQDSFRSEFRILRADTGEVRWLSTLSQLFRDASGKAICSIGAHMDVTDQKKAEEELRASREQLSTVVNQTAVGMILRDLAGNVLMVNDRSCELLGRTREEIQRLPIETFTHPDDCAPSAAMLAANKEHGTPFKVTKRYLRPDGSSIWCEVQVSFVRDAAGELQSSITVASDVSERKRAEMELLSSRALSQSIVECSPDCIALLDLDERLIFMNRSGLVGIDAEGFDMLAGKPWRSFWRRSVWPKLDQALQSAQHGFTGRFTARNPTMAGVEKWWDVLVTPVLDANGAPAQLLTIARDITEQRRAAEQSEWAASHDPLTGLPNRRLFQRELEELLARRSEAGGALLLVDLDRFKEVNDTLGHAAGDSMLVCFAERALECLRGEQIVARLGGDEFAILLPDIGSEAGVDAFVERLLSALAEPHLHERREIPLRASIGSALFPQHASESSELLKCADLALYSAKANNRGGLMHFRSEMLRAFNERSAMIMRARDALAEDRLVPAYQPQFRIGDHSLYGVEALLRWRGCDGALHGPAELIAALEDPPLAAALGRRMQELVLADLRRWLDSGVRVGHVAINAAASEFRQDDFAETLLARMAAHGVPASMVQIEITESVFVGDHAERVARALALLKRNGATIALDDFGTGFSSLSHLKDFPVDVLKIDKSFVQHFSTGKNGAIVRAVLNLGASLNLDVIAEGVETARQLCFIAEHGGTAAQGFLFSKALSFDRLTALAQQSSVVARSHSVRCRA